MPCNDYDMFGGRQTFGSETVYSFPLVSAFRMSTLNELNSLNRDKTVKPSLVILFLVYILARVPFATA
jgi:hypothetical protein